jgi:TP901 family phage tail tape measure protein
MADLKKTIDIVFGAVDNTGKTVKGIGRNIDALGRSAGDIAGPLSSVTDSVLKVDAAIVALGVAMAGIAVKEAAEFQTAFNEISTLFSAAGSDLDVYSADIQNYASTSTQSLENITASLYSSISAGVSYTDSLIIVAQAEKLAVAGKAGLNDTLVSLVSTLNAYGADMDEAGQFSETFFEIVKQGQTTIPELSATLANVTGIAANSGVTFQDLGAAIAALTASGIGTSEAITGIKAALSNVIKPTKDATDEAARLGIEFSAAAIKTKGFGGFIDDVKNKTGGSIDSLSKLFGSVQGLNAVLTLTNKGNLKFVESLKLMNSGAKLLEEAFDKMSQNLGLVAQRMNNNLRLAFVGFGAQILPQFTKDVDAISKVFSSLSFSFNSTDAFTEVYDALNGLGADFEQFALAVAQSLPEALSLVDFSGALDAWGGVGDQLAGLFDGVDVSTPEGLASAIQSVVDSVSSLGAVTEGIASSLVPFVKQIFNAVDAFNGMDESAKLAAGETLGIGKAVDSLLPALNLFSGAVTALGTGLSLLATKGLIDSAGGLKKIIPSFETAAASAGKFAKGVGLIGAAVGGWEIGTLIHDTFREEIDTAADAVLGFADSLFDFTGTGEAFDRQVDQLIGNFEKLGVEVDRSAINLGNIEDYWRQYFLALREADEGTDELSGSMAALSEEAKALAQSNKDLQNASGTYINGVLQTVDAVDNMVDSNKDLIDSGKEVVDSQKKQKDSFELTAREMARAADEAVAFKRKMDLIDKEIVKVGIELEIATVQAQLEYFQGAVQLAMQESVNQVEYFKASLSSLADSISGSQNLIGDLVGSLASGQNLDWVERSEIMALIREEARLKKQQIELQNDLVQAEIDAIELKNDYLKSGGAPIKISADGLEPELEAFMFQILQRIQVRATQEQAAFLIGG